MSRYSNKQLQSSFTFTELRRLINYMTPWLTTAITIEDKEETHSLVIIKEKDVIRSESGVESVSEHLIYFIYDNPQLFERLCLFKSKKKHTVIAYFSIPHYSQVTMRDKGRELGHTVYLFDVPKNYRRKAKYYASLLNNQRGIRKYNQLKVDTNN